LHPDMVLRLRAEDPQDIPTKGRMPIRSAFFGRNKITRRCYDLSRENGTITADEVTVRAMREKGLDPEADRKQRTDFTQRILVSLHDLRRAGTVDKVGAGRGVKWKLAGAWHDQSQTLSCAVPSHISSVITAATLTTLIIASHAISVFLIFRKIEGAYLRITDHRWSEWCPAAGKPDFNASSTILWRKAR
jgi:hypothetical protein